MKKINCLLEFSCVLCQQIIRFREFGSDHVNIIFNMGQPRPLFSLSFSNTVQFLQELEVDFSNLASNARIRTNDLLFISLLFQLLDYGYFNFKNDLTLCSKRL